MHTVTLGTPPPKTPEEIERSMAAINAIRSGKVTIPTRCGWCHSTTILAPPGDEDGELTCGQCGRQTSARTARRLRQQEMRAYIARGIDP